MKSIKRAPLRGAVRNISIILFTIIIVLLFTSMTMAEPNTISNYIITEPSEILVLNRQVEEKTVKESMLATPIEDVPAYKYNVTSEDRETLARLIFLEGNTESLECQKAIASVVINRMYSGYWGNSIDSVVYARNQFTPAKHIPYVTPTATNYEAVDYVLTNGVTLPEYVLYFRVNYHFSWNGYVPYIAIGKTYFGYMAKDKQ